MRTVDYIIQQLEQLGVQHIFGVGGANIEDVYDAIFKTGGRVSGIVAKHEFSAATMADGYSRVTNRLGVVISTSGGGAFNLLPGLAESFASRVPILALVGQLPLTLHGRGGFQDTSGENGSINASQLFSNVAKYCEQVTSMDRIGESVAAALQSALTPPRGPAVLLLPKDIQQSEMPATPNRTRGGGISRRVDDRAWDRERKALRVILSKLRSAGSRIALVAGQEVAREDAREYLSLLAETLDARVCVEPEAKDCFDNFHPRFLGVTGTMGHGPVKRYLQMADAILLVGATMTVMSRTGLEEELRNTPVLAIGRETTAMGPETGRGELLHLKGDLKTELDHLITTLGPLSRKPNTEIVDDRSPFTPHRDHIEREDNTFGFAEVANVLKENIPSNANVLVDAGNTGANLVHYLPCPPSGKFAVALGMGGMGYTFGAGIGAALGNGNRTFVLSGDGSFFMHGLEIHTAVEHHLPITFIVFDNSGHGMCFTRSELYCQHGSTYNLFGPSRIKDGMVHMFPGLKSIQPDSLKELRDFLQTTNGGGPAFATIKVDKNETPPFLPLMRNPLKQPILKGE